ncbi:MAG: DUF4296 domain-containing protein [Cyclobacteriaceae bacterium]
MKKFFLTVLVIVSACSTGNEVPEDLIPQDQMVSVLVEVHMLESKIKNLSIRPLDSAKVVYDHYENLLFADFNITQDQYERSFNYYIENLDEFKDVYTTVVDTLMQREKISKD